MLRLKEEHLSRLHLKLMRMWLLEKRDWWVGALGAFVLVGYGIIPNILDV